MKNENGLMVHSLEMNDLEQNLHQLGVDGKSHAVEISKDHGANGLPKKDSRPKMFLASITSHFNKGITMIRKALSPALGEFNEVEALKELDQQLEPVLKEKQEVTNALRLKQREKTKLEEKTSIPIKKSKRWKRLGWFNFFVVLLDVLVSSNSFQSMGYSYITSLLIGLGVGLCIYLVADHFPEILDRGKTRFQRWLLAIGTYAILTLVFWILGYFRSHGFNGDGQIYTNPAFFCLLNLFFFSVVAMNSLLNKLTRSEKKVLDTWHAFHEDITKLEAKKRSCESQKQQLTAAFDKKKQDYEKVYHYACDLQAVVVSAYEDAILGAYIPTNIQHRSDDDMPDFFEDNPPELNLFFNQKKSK